MSDHPTTKHRVVKIIPTPTPRKGQCPIRPTGNEVVDGHVISPMRWCRFQAGHRGLCSWWQVGKPIEKPERTETL